MLSSSLSPETVILSGVRDKRTESKDLWLLSSSLSPETVILSGVRCASRLPQLICRPVQLRSVILSDHRPRRRTMGVEGPVVAFLFALPRNCHPERRAQREVEGPVVACCALHSAQTMGAPGPSPLGTGEARTQSRRANAKRPRLRVFESSSSRAFCFFSNKRGQLRKANVPAPD